MVAITVATNVTIRTGAQGVMGPGGGNVSSPGSETAGNLAEFTGNNTIAETSLTTASVEAHLVDVANPHEVTAAQVGAEPAGSIATHAADADAHHDELHTLASHSDTATTGPNLDAHIASTANPHSVTAVQAGAEPAGSIATHAALPNAHHDEAHTLASHSDVTTTGAALDGHIADVTGNPHAVTAAQAGAEPAGSIATHAALPNAHHDEVHTIVSHDTTATGANLTTLTDGSDADSLHDHAIADAHIADVTTNPHAVTAAQAGAEPAGSIATHAALSDVHHAEAHTIVSHSDTTATGAELDELTDGSETTLHSHAAGGGDVVGPAGGVVDDEIALFNSTTGKLIKGSSGAVLGDYAELAGATYTGNVTLAGPDPMFELDKTDADADEGRWRWSINGAASLFLHAVTDGGGETPAISFSRNVGAVTSISAHAPLSVTGEVTASDPTSGTALVPRDFGDARYARLIGATFTGAVEIARTSPNIVYNETDAALDEKKWRVRSSSGSFKTITLTDAGAETDTAIEFTRTGTTVDLCTIGSALTVDGVLDMDFNAILNASAVTVKDATPLLVINESDAGTDEKLWVFRSIGGDISLSGYDDGFANPVNALTFARTGTTVDLCTIGSPLTVTGEVTASEPTASTSLATKGYVDGLVQGIEWQDSVISDVLATPPSHVEGARYLIPSGATGDWSGNVDDITQSVSSVWVFTTAVEGMTVAVDNIGMTRRFTSGAWVSLGSTIDHGNTIGLADDDHTQYYNQTRGDARYAQLTGATFTGTVKSPQLEAVATAPLIVARETDAPLDEKLWVFRSNSGNFRLTCFNDSFGGGVDAFNFARTGTTPDLLTINSDLDVNGDITLDGTVDGRDVDADGTVLDGLVPDVARNAKTGLTSANIDLMSINGGDNTKVDMAAGSGYIYDFTVDPENPIKVHLTWTAFIAIDVDNIATEEQTFFYVENTGTVEVPVASVFQNNEPLNSENRRTRLCIGEALHPDHATVFATAGFPILGFDTGGDVDDIFQSLGIKGIEGVKYTDNGNNLLLDRSSGTFFGRGINNVIGNPNYKAMSAAVGITLYIYGHMDGSGGFTAVINSAVDPTMWDDGTGTLATVSTNDFTIQQLWTGAPNELTLPSYGQKVYNTLNAAIDGISENNVVTNPALSPNSVLWGWLVIRQDVTDITLAISQGRAVFRENTGITSQPSGAGTDTNAVHVNGLNEIASITAETTPAVGDFFLLESAADSNSKRSVTQANLLAPTEKTANKNAVSGYAGLDGSSLLSGSQVPDGADGTAIHDNVNSEISALTDKAVPVGGDFLLIEDSAASNAKKRISISNLPASASVFGSEFAFVAASSELTNTDGVYEVSLRLPASSTITMPAGTYLVEHTHRWHAPDNVATRALFQINQDGSPVGGEEEEISGSTLTYHYATSRYFTTLTAGDYYWSVEFKSHTSIQDVDVTDRNLSIYRVS